LVHHLCGPLWGPRAPRHLPGLPLISYATGFVYSADADVDCVFGGLCVDMWLLIHQRSFLQFWLSFDCFWRLVHCWYSLGRRDDWYTNGHFCCFLLSFDCFWRLVHCRYSLGRHVTIGTPMGIFAVLTVFDHWCTNRRMSTKTVPTVYQSSKTVKTAKWPLVYQSSHVYTESAEYTKSRSTKRYHNIPTGTPLRG